jgi:hypothetical protein
MFFDRGIMGLHSPKVIKNVFYLPTALHGTAALPFGHPERTRISCHAGLDTGACAPFSKERRMKFANATKFYRKSGAAEGSAVQRTFRGNVFRPSRVEGPP